MHTTKLSIPTLLSFGLLICQHYASDARGQTHAHMEAARHRMVETIIIPGGIQNQRVIEAMGSTPRHEFVPDSFRKRELAYEDMALPISKRQTISSPFIVAFMTESIDPQPSDRVLEIGTGSGYQAAVLSNLVREVYTVEIVESLGRQARKTLRRLQYDNVHTLIGDGFKGWPEHAPFDKIIVTCSPERVPQPLVDQLKEDGLMVIPVGQRYQQTLYLMQKHNGKLEQKSLRPTLFVPMTGAAEKTREVLPDPENPTLSNTGFEKPPLDTGFIPDWYYQRQAMQVTSNTAPEGKNYLRIANNEPGKPGIAMQGFPVDGRRITHLKVSSWIKYQEARRGRCNREFPSIVVTFYNNNRERLGHRWIGPFEGTSPWRRKTELVRVPPGATEAILQLGLFGAVGEICFDDVRVSRPDR